MLRGTTKKMVIAIFEIAKLSIKDISSRYNLDYGIIETTLQKHTMKEKSCSFYNAVEIVRNTDINNGILHKRLEVEKTKDRINKTEKLINKSNKEKEIGVKHDDGKLRWDLIDFSVLEEVVAVLTAGAKKYSDDNWKHVSPEKYVAAVMRHFSDYRTGKLADPETGESIDPETKLPTLAHVICSIIFLRHFEKNKNK